ncbi:MAG: TerC family protein [Coriobacteriales bacterium]|nr:TerC family protein [Coriobacteriaceae bacterium]MDY2723461.1 TerC family protein [Coriobacteriales bacterium]
MEFLASIVAPLTTVNGWAEVLILMFLEMALGIDNLVFIAITTDRLPKDKQHIGRRLGLGAAMVMRCILLCCVVWIMSINVVLFTLPFGVEDGQTAIDVRDMVFLVGGLYLVYKGVSELKESFEAAHDLPGELGGQTPQPRKRIGLARAVGTIMVMDIVFSLDSVITAAGLSGQILVMIIAVIGAVSIMIVFADPISNFINRNYEIKVVALAFITLVGVELLFEGFHVETIAGAPLSTLLYGMMIFGFAVSLLIMLQRRVRENAHKRISSEQVPAAQADSGEQNSEN